MHIVINQEYRAFKKTMSGTGTGLKGKLRFDEPMSRYTSWRVGGPADRLYVPDNLDDLKLFLSQIDREEPVTWVGLGSNLLVRDGGIRGTVIITKKMDEELVRISDTEIKAAAGISCARLAKFSVSAGLTGAEFLVGIPGTLGGAMAMNAGAFGTETWDIVKSVISINKAGEVSRHSRSEYSVGYRKVKKPDEHWFISAVLELAPDINSQGPALLKELLNKRSETQPIGEASCGSVFRNPAAADAAARLIDVAGLKGTCIGKACVSEKHANFIINRGNATAADIEQLIAYVQDRVYENSGIRLEPEVQVVGEKL